MKKNFTMKRFYYEVISNISDPARRGAVIDAICNYVFNGVEPENVDELTAVAFAALRPMIDSAAKSRRAPLPEAESEAPAPAPAEETKAGAEEVEAEPQPKVSCDQPAIAKRASKSRKPELPPYLRERLSRQRLQRPVRKLSRIPAPAVACRGGMKGNRRCR